MRLIVGGRAQGKRAYLETLVPPAQIADGETCPPEALARAAAVDRLHLLVRRWLEAGKAPAAEALALAEKRPDIIFACDEVGCGIVPLDRKDREWREAVGRVCCALAERGTVERIVCGIPQVIRKSGKEDGPWSC